MSKEPRRYIINLYNHDIPFKKNKSGKLETIEDYNDFITKNSDLIRTIWSIEDDLILQAKQKGGAFRNDFNTMDDVLNHVLLKVIRDKKQSGKFDDKYFKDDFYNEPIKKFKSLFHN
jgi:hypothetical protein